MIFFENYPDTLSGSRWIDTNYSGPTEKQILALSSNTFKVVPLVVERPLKIDAIGFVFNGAGQAVGEAGVEIARFSANENGLPLERQPLTLSWTNPEVISTKANVVIPFEKTTLARGIHYFAIKSTGSAPASIEAQGNFYPWIPSPSFDENYFADVSIAFDASLTTAPQDTDTIFQNSNDWPYLAFKLAED